MHIRAQLKPEVFLLLADKQYKIAPAITFNKAHILVRPLLDQNVFQLLRKCKDVLLAHFTGQMVEIIHLHQNTCAIGCGFPGFRQPIEQFFRVRPSLEIPTQQPLLTKRPLQLHLTLQLVDLTLVAVFFIKLFAQANQYAAQ